MTLNISVGGLDYASVRWGRLGSFWVLYIDSLALFFPADEVGPFTTELGRAIQDLSHELEQEAKYDDDGVAGGVASATAGRSGRRKWTGEMTHDASQLLTAMEQAAIEYGWSHYRFAAHGTSTEGGDVLHVRRSRDADGGVSLHYAARYGHAPAESISRALALKMLEVSTSRTDIA